MKRKRRWDRFAIKAAIYRKGKSLTDLAVENGLERSACRVALRRRHLAGETAIAAFLNLDPSVLWPERYRAGSISRNHSNPAAAAGASPIGRAV